MEAQSYVEDRMESQKSRQQSPPYNTQPAGVEKALSDFYSKTIHLNLPTGGQKWLADNAWRFALLGGVLSLLGAWQLWLLGNAANHYLNIMGEVARNYGLNTANDLGFAWYIVLASMVAQGVIMFLAFTPLKKHQKSGWNLFFYSTYLSVLVGVLYLFMPGFGVGSLLATALGLLIGWFFLFQVRSHFTK